VTTPQPRKASAESVEGRVEWMLARLAQGGEIAQGVVRELFPGGIWLYADPNVCGHGSKRLFSGRNRHWGGVTSRQC
jgi:hypothetical protein